MIRLILSVPVIAVLLAIMILTSLGRAVFLVIRLLAIVVYEWWAVILEAWSQRSGGRAARAERIEIVTVSA